MSRVLPDLDREATSTSHESSADIDWPVSSTKLPSYTVSNTAQLARALFLGSDADFSGMISRREIDRALGDTIKRTVATGCGGTTLVASLSQKDCEAYEEIFPTTIQLTLDDLTAALTKLAAYSTALSLLVKEKSGRWVASPTFKYDFTWVTIFVASQVLLVPLLMGFRSSWAILPVGMCLGLLICISPWSRTQIRHLYVDPPPTVTRRTLVAYAIAYLFNVLTIMSLNETGITLFQSGGVLEVAVPWFAFMASFGGLAIFSAYRVTSEALAAKDRERDSLATLSIACPADPDVKTCQDLLRRIEHRVICAYSTTAAYYMANPLISWRSYCKLEAFYAANNIKHKPWINISANVLLLHPPTILAAINPAWVLMTTGVGILPDGRPYSQLTWPLLFGLPCIWISWYLIQSYIWTYTYCFSARAMLLQSLLVATTNARDAIRLGVPFCRLESRANIFAWRQLNSYITDYGVGFETRRASSGLAAIFIVDAFSIAGCVANLVWNLGMRPIVTMIVIVTFLTHCILQIFQWIIDQQVSLAATGTGDDTESVVNLLDRLKDELVAQGCIKVLGIPVTNALTTSFATYAASAAVSVVMSWVGLGN